MSEGASSLRLLEPRSLAGAERLASRAATPPLVRSTARGASGFADRFFQSWLGVERPVSMAVDRSPRTLGFPAPWYELPNDRRLAARPVAPRSVVAAPGVAAAPAVASPAAPLRELRAIDLVLQSAPPPEAAAYGYGYGDAVEPVAAPPPSIGQRVVDQLARVDQLLRGVIHTPASTVELAALAPMVSRPLGTLGAAVLGTAGLGGQAAAFVPGAGRGAPLASAPVAGSPLGQAFVTAGAPAREVASGTPTLAASQVRAPIGSQPQIASHVQAPQPLATAAQRGIERTLLTPMLVPALSASPVVVAAARAAAARSFATSVAVSTSAVPSMSPSAVPSSAPGAASFAPSSSPVAPSASSFGPGATSFGPGATSFGPGATSFGPGATSFAASSFAFAAPFVTPALAAATYAASPALGVTPGLAMGPAVVWPRLQAFIERIAGPTTLGDAGFVLPAHAQSFVGVDEPLFGGVGRAASAPGMLPYVELASTVPPSQAAVGPARGVARPDVRSLPHIASAIAPTAFAQGSSSSPSAPASSSSSFAPAQAAMGSRGTSAPGLLDLARYAAPATLAGEVARQMPPTSYRPGNLAQRAELLATIAAQRADRQLGTSSVVEQRSVQWSSDAFTVVALAPHIAPSVFAPQGSPGARAQSPQSSGASSSAPSAYATPAHAASAYATPAHAASSYSPPYAAPSHAAPSYVAPSSRTQASFIPAPFASSPFGTAPLGQLLSAAQLAAVMPDAAARSYAGQSPRSVAPFDRALVAPERPTGARALDATERAFAAQGGVLPTQAAAFAAQPGAAPRARQMPEGARAAIEADRFATELGHAAQPFVRVAPMSIASLLAFADSQLGPRLLEGTRPLPVNVPSAVYVQPHEAPQARAAIPSRAPSPPARTFVAPGAGTSAIPGASQAPGQRGARALDLGGDFSLAALGTLGYAPAQAAHEAPQGSAAIGQLGRRSEQLAGELGVRVGSLASEFLIDVQPNFETDTPASTMHAASAGRGWLSTSDWILLSLFPSATTAHQIATSSAAQAGLAHSAAARDGRFPLAANLAQSTLAGSGAQSPLAARPDGSMTMLAGAMAARSAHNELVQRVAGAPDEAQHESPRAVPSMSSLVAPSMSHGDDARTPTTAYLPDGRMPRGNRMIGRSAQLPVVAGAPSASIAATVEATSRRTAAPIGAPLWGQMRALVEPSVTARAPAPTPAQGAGRAAMELVQPYVEAARAESTGSSSFMRQATPVVSATAPDAPTKSLVRALSAASSTPSNDRLTMADLTLISIVSATEQVAAAGSGPAPDVAPASGKGDPNSQHATGAGFGGDIEHEIELVAERALDRMTDELRRHNENKGGTWET